MPWTVDDPPPPAKNWGTDEKGRCVAAANAVLRDGGWDDASPEEREELEQKAVFACIAAAGKSEQGGVPMDGRDWRFVGLFSEAVTGGPFCVLPVGEFRKDGRVIRVTPDDLVQFEANFRAGVPDRDVPVNVEHERHRGRVGRLEDLAARPDGLYARVGWTAKGRELLGEEAFRYFSPEIVWRYKAPDGTDLSNVLVGLALTNYPFFGQKLALFSDGSIEEAKMNEMQGPYQPQRVMEVLATVSGLANETKDEQTAGLLAQAADVLKQVAHRMVDAFSGDDEILPGSGVTDDFAVTKTDDGESYPAAAYLVVEDPGKPSTWHLRIWENPGDKVTVRQLGRAAAALGPGFRGQKYQGPDKEKARKKLVALYRKAGVEDDDIPRYLFSEETPKDEFGGEEMGDRQEERVGSGWMAAAPAKVEPVPAAAPTKVEPAPAVSVEEFAELRAELEAAKAKAEELEGYARKHDELKVQVDEYAERFNQERELRRLMEFTDRAEAEFSAIPGKAEDLGAFLKWAHDADGTAERTHFTYLEGVLKEANQAFADSYAELGTTRGSDFEGTEFERAVAQRAKALQDSGVHKYAEAYVQALQLVASEKPELARHYVNKRQSDTGRR